ncbi:MAG: tetratricopeptide repeat protein [Trichodesmium sp. MO_231.B1]|nr:tetratricopeptide repeat protein [Trichodesmium sp. MO_231.B1]
MNRGQRRKAAKNQSQKPLKNNLPENALFYALSFHKGGQLQEAKIIYEKIIQSEPNNSQVLNYLGVLKAQMGDNNSAINLINKAVNLEPLNFGYLNNLGNTYRAAKQLDNAIDSYQIAIKLNQKSADSHLNLGIALTEKGIIEEAIRLTPRSANAFLEKALSIHPNH